LRFDPIGEASRQWEVHWGPEAVPSMAAVTSIMRAQQILMARLNELLAPLDLTFPRYEALMLVYYSRHQELALGKLSDRLQVHRTSVTNVIDKLTDCGYIDRINDQSDRRMVLARLTEKGGQVAEAATALLNAAQFGMAPLDACACEHLFGLIEPLRREAGDYTIGEPS